MERVLSYSMQSGIVLLLLYAVYKWLLSSEHQPRFNRIMLLIIYMLSLVIPLLPRIAFSGPIAGVVDVEAPIVRMLAGEPTAQSGYALLSALYMAGAGLVLLITLCGICRVVSLISKGRRENRGGFTIVYTDRDDISPLSWWRIILMPQRCEHDDMIAAHERSHIHNMHYLDLLISQIVCMLQWYNPVAWLMQRELKAVHEYQADEAVLQSGYDAKNYQMMLVENAVGSSYMPLSNRLNNSKLKKRIAMMNSEPTGALRRFRALALAPAAVAAVMLLSVPTVSRAVSMPAQAEAPQPVAATTVADPDEAPMKAPEKLPEYKGGMEAMLQFMIENLRYPADAQEAKKQGKVIVSFVVRANGELTDVEVKNPVYPSLDAEAIRVVNAMKGMWIPGMDGGRKVDCHFVLPVNFKLPKSAR